MRGRSARVSTYLSIGSAETDLSPQDLREHLSAALGRLGARKRVIAVPPDATRSHSGAGLLTRLAFDYYGEAFAAVLPALGTHTPMTAAQLDAMFPGVPHALFHAHRWRTDVVTLGEVPGTFVHQQSEGLLDYAWPAQLNRMLVEGGFDLVLSIGQVVPHEVIGMANHSKNLLIGTGGRESINRSHYLGAVYGMERIMGRADTPVRRVLNYAVDHFMRGIPVVYALTVVGRRAEGGLAIRGLFVGDDIECFEQASALSLALNFELMPEPLQKVVVYLEPAEFRSTWLGNKAVYRTRMALADGAELLILAPGVREFGEDAGIDTLIRQFGYHGTPRTLQAVQSHPELAENLSAAAHLIHGSSEGRFEITWSPGGLTREEVEGVGYRYASLDAMLERYRPEKLRDGFNTVGGETIFYISNPGLGLWSTRQRFVT